MNGHENSPQKDSNYFSTRISAPLTTSILKCSEKMNVNPMRILDLPTKDILAKSDKVKNFLDELVPSAKHENYKPRVIKLARSFSTHGPTQDNVRVYQQMNNSFSIISPKALPHGI